MSTEVKLACLAICVSHTVCFASPQSGPYPEPLGKSPEAAISILKLPSQLWAILSTVALTSCTTAPGLKLIFNVLLNSLPAIQSFWVLLFAQELWELHLIYEVALTEEVLACWFILNSSHSI